MDNSERFVAGELGGSSYELDANSSSPRSEGYDDLDADLWSSLPPHLIEKILAWLPIPAFLRFRTVCTTWNKLLHSPGFLRECTDVPSQGPWFLMFKNDHYREAATYNPSLDRWHPIPLVITSAPGQISFHVAAAGGLLAYYAAECDSVVVCNPLTRAWRKLPLTLRIQFFQPVAMVSVPGRYHIVVAGIWAAYGACYPTAEVFDSETNAWRITANTPPSFPLHPPGVLCHQTLYWRNHEPHGLTTFDLTSNKWSSVRAPLPPAFESYGLAECRDAIFIIGTCNKCVCILELKQQQRHEQDANLVWEEVDRMPAGLMQEFLQDAAHDAYFRCIGHSRMVLISMCGRQMPQMLYDLARRVWRRLPRCPVPDHRMVDGFSFEPRLDASV